MFICAQLHTSAHRQIYFDKINASLLNRPLVRSQILLQYLIITETAEGSQILKIKAKIYKYTQCLICFLRPCFVIQPLLSHHHEKELISRTSSYFLHLTIKKQADTTTFVELYVYFFISLLILNHISINTYCSQTMRLKSLQLGLYTDFLESRSEALIIDRSTQTDRKILISDAS